MYCHYSSDLKLTKEEAIAFEKACRRVIEGFKKVWDNLKETVSRIWESLKDFLLRKRKEPAPRLKLPKLPPVTETGLHCIKPIYINPPVPKLHYRRRI